MTTMSFASLRLKMSNAILQMVSRIEGPVNCNQRKQRFSLHERAGECASADCRETL